MNLTPAQLDLVAQLSDQWSFLWDKRRSLWIAAEDCLDGDQVEEADLNTLLVMLHRLQAESVPAAGAGSTASSEGPARWLTRPLSSPLASRGQVGPAGDDEPGDQRGDQGWRGGLARDQGKHCQAQDSRDGTANDQAQRSAAADPGGQLCCGG
jgi:hypothetical protein